MWDGIGEQTNRKWLRYFFFDNKETDINHRTEEIMRKVGAT